jgi:hypothetical protein
VNVARVGYGGAVSADGRMFIAGGVIPGLTASVEAYGPAIAISPTSGPRGSTTSLGLESFNFAANATVDIYLGDDPTPIATGKTDAAGKLTAAVIFTIPPTVPFGATRVEVVDDRS